MGSFFHCPAYRGVIIARHVDLLAKHLDTFLMGPRHEYVVMMGSGLGQTIRGVEVKPGF